MNEMEMKEMVEEFDELFQKGMKLTHKWKQKMGMRQGYPQYMGQAGGYNQNHNQGQNMNQMGGGYPMMPNAPWFDPKYM